MLMRTDPFRELDRLTQQVFGTTTRPTVRVKAEYDAGVLRLTIPVAEQAKPHRITIATDGHRHAIKSWPSAVCRQRDWHSVRDASRANGVKTRVMRRSHEPCGVPRGATRRG